MKKQELENFIESWGGVVSLLGFNASTARVHALLMASEEEKSLDEISEFLQISRGNASMCLKELKAWGVVNRVSKPGDRRSYYCSESDIWKMGLSIVRERKRRDFDPAFSRVHRSLAVIEEGDGRQSSERLLALDRFLGEMSGLLDRFLAEDEAFRPLLGLLLQSGK